MSTKTIHSRTDTELLDIVISSVSSDAAKAQAVLTERQNRSLMTYNRRIGYLTFAMTLSAIVQAIASLVQIRQAANTSPFHTATKQDLLPNWSAVGQHDTTAIRPMTQGGQR